jgi:lysophospholipase L1-like esterase
VALVTAAGLNTDLLVGTAERLPYGTSRSVLVAATGSAHRLATAAGLDSAGIAVDGLSGRRDAPAQGSTDTDVAGTAGIGVVDQLAALIGPTRAPIETATSTTLRSEPLPTASARAAIADAPPSIASEASDDRHGGSSTVPPDTTSDGPGFSLAPGHLLQALAVAFEEGVLVADGPMRPVDPSDKLRLWAGGDSLGEYVGNQLLSPKADAELTDVMLDYHISTGLARPDYFDWLAQIDQVMQQTLPPEALVFMVGGNDDQNMLADDEVLTVGTDPWYAEYRRRVAAFMDTSATGGSHLYWIGLPPMREPRRETISVEINDILAAEAATRPWVTFVDIYSLFSGVGGGYQSHLLDPDGNQRLARAPDGVHITFAGSGWVADEVWAAIAERWELDEGAFEVRGSSPGSRSGPGGGPQGLTRPEPAGSGSTMSTRPR